MAHDAADFLSEPVHNLADESGRMIGAVRVIGKVVTHPGFSYELDAQGIRPIGREEFLLETNERHIHVSAVVGVAVEIQVDQGDGVPELG